MNEIVLQQEQARDVTKHRIRSEKFENKKSIERMKLNLIYDSVWK